MKIMNTGMICTDKIVNDHKKTTFKLRKETKLQIIAYCQKV